MRDYQRTKNNKYWLPKYKWQETLYYIRGYYEDQEEISAILVESPAHEEGMPSGGGLSNEPQNKAERLEHLMQRVRIIERSLELVPPEYRKGVWDNIHKQARYPDYADRRTYGRWKSRYVYAVAVASGKYEGKSK